MVWMENILLADDESLNEINNNLRLIEKKDGLTFGSDAYPVSYTHLDRAV